jgi:hypothetical protein
VTLELEVADPYPESHKQVVGVDVGQRYLAVTATPTNDTSFYSGKQVRAKADHYARLRKRLQKKGTRSTTRRLLVISGRERRLKQDRNHLISRRIVDAHPHSIIGLEETLHSERCLSGKTGRARGTCRLPLMCRAMKPKLHACKGMQNCGGAQIQASAFRHGVIDRHTQETGTRAHQVRVVQSQRLQSLPPTQKD